MLHYDLNVKLKTHCSSLTLPCMSLLFFINGLAAAGSWLGLGLSQSQRDSSQEPCPALFPTSCQTRELPSVSLRSACPGACGTYTALFVEVEHLEEGAEAALNRCHNPACH